MPLPLAAVGPPSVGSPNLTPPILSPQKSPTKPILSPPSAPLPSSVLISPSQSYNTRSKKRNESVHNETGRDSKPSPSPKKVHWEPTSSEKTPKELLEERGTKRRLAFHSPQKHSTPRKEKSVRKLPSIPEPIPEAMEHEPKDPNKVQEEIDDLLKKKTWRKSVAQKRDTMFADLSSDSDIPCTQNENVASSFSPSPTEEDSTFSKQQGWKKSKSYKKFKKALKSLLTR